MKLQLKKEFAGQVITRRFTGIGYIELDTNKLDSRKILNYYRNGFEDIFEYVEPKEVVVPNTFADLTNDIVEPVFEPVPTIEPKDIVEPVVESKLEMIIEDITEEKVVTPKKKTTPRKRKAKK